MKLNAAQRMAVTTLSGPLLVLAGAGTGKTRVITYRITELIRHGTRAERIWAVTFTNKAAAEMQERVGQLLGKRLKARPVISTFHAYCVQILRRHIRQLGYPQKFSIYDRSDQEGIARSVLREIKVADAALRPGDLLQLIGHWKSHGISPAKAASMAASNREHLAASAFRRYQKALKNAGAVDFDDLLLCTEQLFHEVDPARQEEAARFDHILVDEYQDTNATQYRIVRYLASGHRNLCVVGDDDQSIYGWRGADVQHILNFRRDWPEATVVRLEENYRCTAEILACANRLIAFNKHRYQKVLRAARPAGERPRIEQYKDETTEAKEVVADIRRRLTQPGVHPGDFAILFRTNEQPRAFESELRRVKLPYVLIGGMSFFDRREVRDVLSYLKIMDSPDDEQAMLRILNTPPRGIGNRTIELLLQTAVQRSSTVWEVMVNHGWPGSLPAAAQAAIQRFTAQVTQFADRMKQAAPRRRMHEVLQQWLQLVNYEVELRRLYDDPNDQQARWAIVEEIVNALAAYESRSKKKVTLHEFLSDMALGGREMDDEKDKQLQRNAIVLMTLHSAKGLEFPYVYMVGMEEGILPHHRSMKDGGASLDEERRLCYVGITRAQERLTFSLAQTRRKWGKPRETHASPFLFELIGQTASK